MRQLLRKSLIFFMSFLITLPVLFTSVSDAEAERTYVKGYYRDDGTYVKGHYRDTGGGSSSSYTGSKKEPYKTGNLVNLYKGKYLITTKEANSLVFVQGYYRDNGVYVRPHFRTHANNFLKDNLSYNGLSSLLPITSKYPSFTYSSEPTTASVERYLLSVVLPYSLNQKQVNNLKLYASKLAQKDASSINYGKSFYNGLGFSSELAQSQADFDEDGLVNLDTYLYMVLIQQGKFNLTDVQRNELETYKGSLKNAMEDNSKKSSARTNGLFFYKSLGMGFLLAYEQAEMDLLQNEIILSSESGNDSSTTTVEQNAFFDFSAYPYEVETFKKYIRAVLKTYSLKKDFTNSFSLAIYAITLYAYSDSIEYSFAKVAIQGDGLSFYKEIGLTEEAAKKQAEIDFNAIVAAYGNK